MNRLEFLKLLGIGVLAVPIVAALPTKNTEYNPLDDISAVREGHKEWEESMSLQLKGQVRMRMNHLVRRMYEQA